MSFFRFDHPELLWLVLLVAPIVWLGGRRLGTLDPARRWTAISVRALVLTILVLMLSGLQVVRRHGDLTVIAVVDQSQSVRRFVHPPAKPPADAPAGAPASESIEQWVDQFLRTSADDQRPDDKFGYVTFDARPTVRAMPRQGIDLDPGTVNQPRDGTDTASAIRMAMAQFPPDSGARLVLVSDGNDSSAAHAPNAADASPGSAQGPGRGRGDSGDASGGTTSGAASGGGGLLTAAREAAAAGVPIDVLPLHYRVKHEVMVAGVHAPTQARAGQTLAVRVVLRATQPTAGTLQVLQDGQVVDFNGKAPGTGVPITKDQWSAPTRGLGQPAGAGAGKSAGAGAGANPGAASGDGAGQTPGGYVLAKRVQLPAGGAGPTRFEAVFEPDHLATSSSSSGSLAGADDEMAANNKAQGFTLVSGKGEVLFVDNIGGSSGSILPRALKREGIQVRVVGPGGIPTTLARMQKYDAVAFQNVPAELVTGPQQKMLTRYVHDLGGGFVMVGGPKSFGAGGWTNTPIDKYILPVNCQIPSQTILPSGALALVLDRSGSMSASVGGTNKTQQQLADEAAVLAHATLYPQDVICVIAFDSSAAAVVNPQLNKDPAQVVRKIRSIGPGGGTNIYSGLEMAYHKFANLSTQDAAIKHVILLTDGDSTAPSTGGYVKIVGKMRQAGITLSTVGVGDGHNAALLAQLAQMGGGHYYPIKDPNNLPQVFIKEARTIRKNLIKEKTFTPKLVNTGSPIMAGVHGVPKLEGLVLTSRRKDPRVFTPMLGPDGEPLFAHWQVGLGRAAAFTSDATNKWASPWLKWSGYADFWARTIREVARPSASREADLTTTVRGDTLHLRLDASGGLGPESEHPDAGGRGFGNFLRVRGAVLEPGGSTRDVTLKQTGPGVYEAALPANGPGNYIASLVVQGDRGRRYTVFGGVSEPPGRELRTLRSHDAMLRRVARMTGGRVLDPARPRAGGLFSRAGHDFTARSVRPVWRTLLVILLVLFLLDVANRRVAWDLRASWAWTRARVASAAGSLRARPDREEGTLSAWKKIRAGGHAQPEPGAGPVADAGRAASSAPTPPPRQRKFEAEPDAAPSGDFTQAVGGASREPAGSPLAASARSRAGAEDDRGAEDADQGPTTSRLLGAKRRARDQYHSNSENNPPT